MMTKAIIIIKIKKRKMITPAADLDFSFLLSRSGSAVVDFSISSRVASPSSVVAKRKSLPAINPRSLFKVDHSIIKSLEAASAFSSPGTRLRELLLVADNTMDCFIWAALVLGLIDQRSAIAPVTNGAAKLVPLI